MIYPKQFVISPKAYTAENFQSFELANGFVLSYHNNLSVFLSDDKRIILLGDAWQADPARQPPIQGIRELLRSEQGILPLESILKMEESWCGRYVLIVQGNVFLDVSGLLGVFYSAQGISSSCGLLANVMGLQERIFEGDKDCNWLPGPLTQYEEIKRILPGQVYNYIDHKSISRNLLSDRSFSDKTEQELLKIFADYFSSSLKNMAAMFADAEVYIALTGGYDSRAVAALAEYAGIHYKCYTQEHENMTVGDIEVPEEICAALHKEYMYIGRDPKLYSPEKATEYIRHTSGLANDADKLYYAYQQYEPLFGGRQKKVLLLRGGIWENVIEYYRKYFSDVIDPETVFDYFNANNHPLLKESLMKYFELWDEGAQANLSDCNRFYWEQRDGSWLSSIEQGFDLLENVKSFQVLNCRLLLTILINFPREKRISKMHEADIAAFACPAMKNIPYGSNKRINGRKISKIDSKIKKAVKRLKSMGLKKTVKTYIRILTVESEIKKLRK